MTALSPVKDSPVLGHSVYRQRTEKVLALHDWMRDAANYEPMIPLRDANAYTYMFADLRGYGRSRHLASDFSAGEVASDALRLADHLGWRRFHVIGHSITGLVVQRMALYDWTSQTMRLKSPISRICQRIRTIHECASLFVSS